VVPRGEAGHLDPPAPVDAANFALEGPSMPAVRIKVLAVLVR